MIKIGIGYDIHPLEAGRPLILGGIRVSHGKGLKGHSDADVLIHAVCNAILGALGEGDLGSRYPNSDPRYRDYDSAMFLADIASLLNQRGYRLSNLDSVIIAQEPKLSGYLPEMRSRIAKVLDVDGERVNVKAATPEGLGALGHGEGIAAQAVCLIETRELGRDD